MKVLIVDDVKAERLRLVDAFTNSSEIVVVGAVARLHMALHAIGEDPPDVIVTDTKLGDDHAVHLITAARRCVVPPAVVVWSTQDSIDERRRCLEAGASRYVPKAAGVSTLARAIAEAHATRARANATDRFALIGRLSAGVAHDLNNYLAVIDVSLALMKTSEADELRQVVASASRLTANLTRYARGSSPPYTLVDLSAIVERVAEQFRRSLPLGVTLALELDTVPVIEGNELELEQLVLNLMLNAADASPDGSTVTLRVRSPAANVVYLIVEDRGPGVPRVPADASLIPSTKRHGVGLGLGIVRAVASRHRASLRVDGNRVTVELPAVGNG